MQDMRDDRMHWSEKNANHLLNFYGTQRASFAEQICTQRKLHLAQEQHRRLH